jgi:hypothetical protein
MHYFCNVKGEVTAGSRRPSSNAYLKGAVSELKHKTRWQGRHDACRRDSCQCRTSRWHNLPSPSCPRANVVIPSQQGFILRAAGECESLQASPHRSPRSSRRRCLCRIRFSPC